MNDDASTRRRSRMRIVLWVVGALVAVFIVSQFIPYGRDRINPPVTNDFVWASPEAEAIARRSCYDCHSNETKWWWATKIAPASWLVWNDISGGRENLNFSEWSGGVSAEDVLEAVNGEMPPFQYTLMHRDAVLSEEEKQTLVSGFAASVDTQSGGSGESGESGSTTPSASPSAAAGDPVALIDERCAICHTADRALEFRATSAAEAQALLDAMIEKGADLSAAEQQLLVEYYVR